MRIAITGASGFVGRQLVPLLKEQGASLLLIGRAPELLCAKFPGTEAIPYADISTGAIDYDMLLHLAVINNDKDADWEEIQRVNVELAVETCRQALAAGITTFVFVSSIRALDNNDTSPYAVSKRIAANRLAEIEGIRKVILYLPAVVGGTLAGKLRILNRLPAPLRRGLLLMLASIKPTVRLPAIVESLVGGMGFCATPGVDSQILSDGQAENRFFSISKRLIDIGFSLAILAFLWWVMLIIWAGVRLQSSGPGIFRQVRVGRDEANFTCLKFRTMYLSAPNAGTHEVSADEVTPFGRLLRNSKLDELPQVFNILRNEMSLVGPRPCLPSQSAVIAERRAQGVFRAKPGITGFAQIRRLDMSDPVKLAAIDRQYIALQSLTLDLKIIARTLLGSGSGDKVRTDKVRNE